MAEKINLLKEFEAADTDRPALERIRIGSDEVAIIPFIPEAESIDLHYCREPDVADYVACNGEDCILCRIGRALVTRHLLPVYFPEARAVAVLPVGTSRRPYALWPQLVEALKLAPTPQVVFITREQGDRYRVASKALAPDVDAGEKAIKAFQEDNISLASVYPKIPNEELARIPQIAEHLRLKGIGDR